MSKVKVRELVKLVEEYGESMTIGQILEEQDKKYKCPLCLGSGSLGIKIINKGEPLTAIKGHNAPLLTHLLKLHVTGDGVCTLCEGEGYLEDDFIPVQTPVITGYMQRPMK